MGQRYPSLPPEAVEVYVVTDAEAGWYFGTMREWTFYRDIGWTGFVTYNTSASQRRNGRFLAEHIRQLSRRSGP